MTTTITIMEVIPGLNGSKGLKRENHHAYKKRRDRYQWTVTYQTRNRHPGKVKFILTRYSIGPEMDFENLTATGKCLTDAIVLAGVIKDDSPKIIVQREYRNVIIPRKERSQQKTTITLIDAE
ncbi:hypothetical protein BWI97_15845 [Siphonobacter sp. BAB-5405]|uniref:hypothetical protein n=1 Tax=Siphonobacter sp. BAB-5405 TaxID=1864825 RepID=UPI000C7FA49A|nr:hypothetical protein [Siphonobacter sp. BAB-5405]PMD94868.1 hypothetical protein BWI97_15845 [Siphonobacter sp. BAB-5405]